MRMMLHVYKWLCRRHRLIAVTVFLLSLAALAIIAFVASPSYAGYRVAFPVEPALIQAGQGRTFVYRLPIEASSLTTFCADSNEQPNCSGLDLLEDGRLLGPPHSNHAELAEKGGGRYSHWAGYILFSTPAGDDPRTNGRVYEVRIPFKPTGPWLAGLAVFVAAVAALAGWIARKTLGAVIATASAPWQRGSGRPEPAPVYRADIDGLRAVSVISVMLVHYGVGGIPGGFTGVDIFFVISGYLITSIIWGELSRGEFSIAGFYARRFRRILPALVTVLVVVLAAGSVLLTPDMYLRVAQSAIAAALGFGNIFFYANTGYFDAEAKAQPLLHTWSLGVEEQFYLVWPLLLGIVAVYARHSRLAIVAMLLTLIGVSFAASVYYVDADKKWAFYGPLTRAWELGLGALLVFIPTIRFLGKWTANILALIGAGLIAWSFVMIDEATSFPGPNALFACIGAALLILPYREPTLVGQALSVPPMRLIGLLSYSLYLWHWPVFVLAMHFNNGFPLSVSERGGLMALSIGLSWLTWRYLETPFRRSRGLSPSRTVSLGLATIGALCALGFVVVKNDGFPSRLPDDARRYYDLDVMWRWPCPAEVVLEGRTYCSFGAAWSTASQRAILYGDSMAEHLTPLLHLAAAQNGASVLLINNCPPQLGGGVYRHRVNISGYEELCVEKRRQLMLLLWNEKPHSIIFNASWSRLGELRSTASRLPDEGNVLLRRGIEEIMPALAEAGARVWLLGGTATLEVDPASCSVGSHTWFRRRTCRNEVILTSRFERENASSHTVMRELAGRWPNLRFLSLGGALCVHEGACLSSLNGEPLYRDTDHFRRNLKPETAEELARRLSLHQIFED